MRERFETWLAAFNLQATLHAHARCVFLALPDDVLNDFVGDPAFTMIDYDHAPGIAMEVPVGAPVARRASRSVVLKRSLGARPAAFGTSRTCAGRFHSDHEQDHARGDSRHPVFSRARSSRCERRL